MREHFGGKDNFAVDRLLADRVAVNAPVITVITVITVAARENRAFLGRAARYAAEAGVRQFLDIGAGFPTMNNTNEVVHAVAPDARVVYIDNDPVVLAHGRALLAGRDASRTRMVAGDLRAPQRILSDPLLLAEIDLSRPVAVLLVAIMHFIRDDEDPSGIVARLRGAMAPGSLLILSHATFDYDLRVLNNARVYNDASVPFARAPARRWSGCWPGSSSSIPVWWSRRCGARTARGPSRPSTPGGYAAVGRRP